MNGSICVGLDERNKPGIASTSHHQVRDLWNQEVCTSPPFESAQSQSLSAFGKASQTLLFVILIVVGTTAQIQQQDYVSEESEEKVAAVSVLRSQT